MLFSNVFPRKIPGLALQVTGGLVEWETLDPNPPPRYLLYRALGALVPYIVGTWGLGSRFENAGPKPEAWILKPDPEP